MEFIAHDTTSGTTDRNDQPIIGPDVKFKETVYTREQCVQIAVALLHEAIDYLVLAGADYHCELDSLPYSPWQYKDE